MSRNKISVPVLGGRVGIGITDQPTNATGKIGERIGCEIISDRDGERESTAGLWTVEKKTKDRNYRESRSGTYE